MKPVQAPRARERIVEIEIACYKAGLVKAGKARAIGVSNFEIAELKRVQAVASKPIACNQFETHPYYQRGELLAYCTQHGILVTAHSSDRKSVV